jgi:hypothetical protein
MVNDDITLILQMGLSVLMYQPGQLQGRASVISGELPAEGNILCTGAFLCVPYSFLLVSNNFYCPGGGGGGGVWQCGKNSQYTIPLCTPLKSPMGSYS